MFFNPFRRLLPLVLLGCLALSSCVVREHGRYGYDRDHDRDHRDHHDRDRDDRDHHNRRY